MYLELQSTVNAKLFSEFSILTTAASDGKLVDSLMVPTMESYCQNTHFLLAMLGNAANFSADSRASVSDISATEFKLNLAISLKY